MGTLRIEIELNKGRRGVPLQKLARINEEFEKFLRSLSTDIGFDTNIGQWVGVDFKNSSVTYGAECLKSADDEIVEKFNRGINEVAEIDPNEIEGGGRICSIGTYQQFAKIADPIDDDEAIAIRTLDRPEEDHDGWKVLTKKRAEEISKVVSRVIEYEGTIFGTIYLLNNGATPKRFFDIRDAVSGALVKCFYQSDAVYRSVVKALENQSARIYARGRIRASVFDRKIEYATISRIEVAPEYHDGDIDKLGGSLKRLGRKFNAVNFVKEFRSRVGPN